MFQSIIREATRREEQQLRRAASADRARGRFEVAIRASLEQAVQIRASMIPEAMRRFHYLCPEAFVLEHGAAFQPAAEHRARRPFHAYAKLCFYNAQRLAARSSERLRYCEGYAIAEDLPFAVHHGWCVNEAGEAVDLTWSEHAGGAGRAYLGVIFSEADIARFTSRDNCSLLDNWQGRWALLQAPWSPAS